ncbi:hypothetical protein G6F43_006033 [Rhizopus delemar]|nr:hypothetical protein G6F43_006033 [Rhizopus delemar]
MGIRAAAQKLNINVRTAQGWVSKNNNPQEYIQMLSGGERPVGRLPVLTDEHKHDMIQWADENTDSVVLEDMLDVLTEKLGYLQITRSGCYKFIRQKSLRMGEEMDGDSLGFHKQLCVHRRSSLPYKSQKFSWSKAGSCAVVKVPRTRAKTTTLLGAISPFSIVNKSSNHGGTVTGRYFNLINRVLDGMDRHAPFRGHYLIMDNAPIHTHEDIQKHIESRSYGCVYLPPYSLELNPIEQFWSVCKSKLKREQLLDEEA